MRLTRKEVEEIVLVRLATWPADKGGDWRDDDGPSDPRDIGAWEHG